MESLRNLIAPATPPTPPPPTHTDEDQFGGELIWNVQQVKPRRLAREMNEGDSCRFDKTWREWQEVCLSGLGWGGGGGGARIHKNCCARKQEECVILTASCFFVFFPLRVGCWFSSYWREIVLPLLLLPCPHHPTPPHSRHRPPRSLPPLPHLATLHCPAKR